MTVRLREGLRVEEIDGEAIVLDRDGSLVHRFTGNAVEALRLLVDDIDESSGARAPRAFLRRTRGIGCGGEPCHVDPSQASRGPWSRVGRGHRGEFRSFSPGCGLGAQHVCKRFCFPHRLLFAADLRGVHAARLVRTAA